MKVLKRGVKRGVRVFLPKIFNLFVILSLVLQPVGSAGIWNVVLAQSTDPVTDIVVTDVPAVEPTAPTAEEPAPVVEEPASAVEEPAPADEPVAEEPAPVEEATTVTEEETAPADTTLVSTPSIGDTGATTDIPSNVEDTTTLPAEENVPVVILSETPALTEEIAPTETPAETPIDTSADTDVTPAVEPAETTPVVLPVEEVLATLVVADEPVDDTVCLAASVTGDSEGNWNVDEANNTAVTNDPVQLGVRYVYPLDKEVTVTFTCLPKDESRRAPLKIERIKASDINLPDGTIAVSEYAYDITTEGMENGDFKYDLELPKADGVIDPVVSYVEKSADEIKGEDLQSYDVKEVEEQDVKTKENTFEVEGLDHFTTFFIATYSSATFTIEKSVYTQGETVFVKATNFNIAKYYKLSIDPPSVSDIYITSCFNPENSSDNLTGMYTLAADATVSTSWQAELQEFDSSDCSDGDIEKESDNFSVVAPKPDLVAIKSHAPEGDAMINQTFTWTILVQNNGLAVATFTNGEELLKDERPSTGVSSYGSPSAVAGGGATGTVNCSQSGTNNRDLTCTASGTVTLPIAGYFDVSYTVIPSATGNLNNPRNGGTCKTDRNTDVTESNENNNSCSETVTVNDPPYTETQICHATGSESNPYNLISPNTIGVLMGHVGNSHQNGEDIIPPVPFYLPLGQNWDAAGEAIWNNQCAIPTGTIIVHKDVQGPNGENVTDASNYFEVSLDAGTGQAISDDLTVTYNNVPVGSHTITESLVDPDYTLYGIGSVAGTAGNLGGLTINVTTGTNDVYVTNRQKSGTITVVKDVVGPNGGPISDAHSFTVNLAPGTQSSSFAEENNAVFTVNPGIYTASESDDPDYTELECLTATGKPEIVVASGGAVTITCTNQQKNQPGRIIVEKDVVPDGDATFDFTIEGDLIETIGFVLGDGDVSDSYVLSAATYTVSEESDPLYITTVECVNDQEDIESADSLTLDPGETITCTYTNTLNPPDTGSITIVKDANPDSAQNFGYAMNGAGFVEFVLDDDVDPLLSNTATFTSLASGTYTVTEGLVSGWTLESVTCISDIQSLAITTEPIRTIELGTGENVTCTYLNTQNASAPVCGDGEVNQETEQCDGTDGVTEGENFCTFSCTLVPIYTGGDTCSEGTEPILVQTKFVESFMTDGIIPDPIAVSFEGGKEYLIESVGHFGYGGVPLNNTLNRADAGYASDTNWAGPNIDTLFGSPATALYRGIHSLISDMGTGTFGVVDWGSYNTSHIYAKHFTPATDTDVRFAISDWYDTWYSGDELSDFNKNQFGFRDNEGGLTINVYECQEQEQFIPPVLQIAKSNDSTSPENPGNSVTYTITVTAPKGNTTDVEDVVVTDLPPEGFEFVAGSDVASQGSLTSPYASPGVWSLGTMTPGQTITLSYQVAISGNQDAGNYNDLAFARGTSAVGADVLAEDPEDTDNFVGTDVEVVLPVAPAEVALTNIVERDVDTKTIHKTKRVLGAATILPSTGANVNTILLALLALISGLILILLGKRSTWNLIRNLSKSMMKVFLFVIVGSLLFAGQSASAAPGDLNVQIETPKAQVNDPDFKIGFVALDILGRTVTVDCEKKGQSDGSFSVFESIPLIAGGSSGDCTVNASVMPTDGIYQFRVTATAGSDSETAGDVSVNLISGIPSTPLDYSRAEGSCTASFTTANDGLTDKVELYRSTSSTFTANSSTLVATSASIGPNVAGTLTDASGDCGGSYFYAIRAIALSGLGSGFVGDEKVVVDHENKIKTETDTKKVAGPVTTLGAIPVASEETLSGAVEGAATESGEETVQPAAEQEGSVLGSATEAAGAAAGGLVDWIKNHPWWSLLWLIIIVLIAYFARRIYFGNYNENNQ